MTNKLSKQLAIEALLSHDHTLADALRAIARTGLVPDADLKTLVDELNAENLLALGRAMTTDPEARKRVNNTLAREAKVAPVVWRGKKEHPCGQCYVNAYREFLATGNPIAYGWINGNTVSQDYFLTYIPHAFNCDKETGQYYDTTYYVTEARQRTYAAFVVTDLLQEFANKDVRTNPTAVALDKNLGGWVFVAHKGKTYVLRGWDHSGRDEPTKSHYKTMKCVGVV